MWQKTAQVLRELFTANNFDTHEARHAKPPASCLHVAGKHYDYSYAARKVRNERIADDAVTANQNYTFEVEWEGTAAHDKVLPRHHKVLGDGRL